MTDPAPAARPDEPFPDYYNDLAGTLAHAWQMIGRATQDRKCAFHTPVVSTSSPNEGPQARVMVLRRFDADTRRLSFYTDLRSAKIPVLAHDPRVAVTFYDAPRKVQLRLNGLVAVHAGDALAHDRWKASGESSLRCYLGRAPGTPSAEPTSGLPSDMQASIPSRAELAPGQQHFAVLEVDVQRLEWLYLHSRGQRRALYQWQTGAAGQPEQPGKPGHWAMGWLNP
jgi:pyridoxamine 5'-phosphate oxidase